MQPTPNTTSVEEQQKKKRGRPPGAKNKATAEEVMKFVPTGTDVGRLIDASTIDFNPSAKQQEFAKLILTSDHQWTYTSLAGRIGVDPATLSIWFNDQRFRIWYENLRARLFLLYKPQIDKALLDKATEGSIKHQELFYAMVGDLARIEAERSAEVQKIDSLGTSEQWARFTERVTTIIGRGEMAKPASEPPPRIDISVNTEEDDE